MKNILIILKKELKRFFFDRRMLIAMFLPGILMFVLYTFMGNIMRNNLFSTASENTQYEIVYTVNYASDTSALPKVLQPVNPYFAAENKGNSAHYTAIQSSQVEEYKTKLVNKEIHLLITFSDNFEEKVNDATSQKNNISIFYNAETKESSNIYNIIQSFVGASYNNYTVNMEDGVYVNPDFGKQNAIMVMVVSFILPMATVSVLYATISSFCPESISGEKERGTLASILLTPIKTKEFILGKILALSIVAVASGIVSFLGLIFSMPSMMGMSSLPIAPVEAFLLLLIIVSTLFLFVAFGVLISSLSNTVKEAGSYLGPFSALFLLLGIIPPLAGNSLAFAFVPVLNLSSCVSAIFSQAGNLPLMFGITIGINLLFTVLFVFLVTRLFTKERIILGQ